MVLALTTLVVFGGCSRTQPAQGSPGSATIDQDREIIIAGYRDPVLGEKDPYYINYNLFVWEPLVGMSDRGEPSPAVAERWEMSSDAREWTFYLRKTAVFSDGVPCNAEAVIKNFDRYKTLGFATSSFFYFNYEKSFPDLVEYVALDEYTIKLTFKNPQPTLPYTIPTFGSPLVSPNCFDPETGLFTGHCVGTGPFVIKEHLKDQYVVLERNEKYDGKPAAPRQVRIRVIPDEDARILALRSGEIVGVYDNNAIQSLAAQELESTKEFTVSAAISANIRYMGVNNKNWPFSDVRMRRAASMIIDRDTLIREIQCGYGLPIVGLLSPMNQFYKEFKPEYNPETAKKLAAEVLQGQTPTVRLVTSPNYRTDAELIAAWLGELGLKIDIQVFDSAGTTNARKTGAYDICMAFRGMDNYDPFSMLETFMDKTGIDNVNYAAYYSNPRADALIEQLRNTYTMDERIKLYNSLQDICVEDLPNIGLFSIMNITVHSNRIAGYKAMFTGVTLPDTEWTQ
jgi:peptide/nickel transport system substrate-binding protein